MTARYSRQTVLPEIGPQGQMLLGKARILVVGAGGLGAEATAFHRGLSEFVLAMDSYIFRPRGRV